MNAGNIQDYCRRFFQATGCTIREEKDGAMEVELTLEIDKELTDRPYYWLWVEATGEEVKPSVLNLQFTTSLGEESGRPAERVVLGSYRLNKLFAAAKKRGKYTCQYQRNALGELEPYLLVNGKLSFLADRRRDEILSLGINLYDGEGIEQFFPKIRHLPFSADRFPGHTLRPARLSLAEAWDQIVQMAFREGEKRDPSWAVAALQDLQREKERLETYYNSLLLECTENASALTAEKELRLAELISRYQPRMEFVPFQMALLYIKKEALL